MKRVFILLIMLFISLEIFTHDVSRTDYVAPLSTPLSLRALYNYAEQVGIKHVDIVVAQAVLESGNFKSKVFRATNNLFGMRLPKSRKTTAVGSKMGFSVYNSWQSSVEDYKLWQDGMIHKARSATEYYTYLGNHYAQDSTYIITLKKHISHRK